MYLSIEANTQWSVQSYVQACCPTGARPPADDVVLEVADAVARELSASLLDTAHRWAPSSCTRLPQAQELEQDGSWILDVAESRLRAAGFRKDEIDALYQHVSEVAERPDRRARVARRLMERWNTPAGCR